MTGPVNPSQAVTPLKDLFKRVLTDAGPDMRLYAVVDASRSPLMIPPALRAKAQAMGCLYKGRALKDFGDRAAWVVEINFSRGAFSWLVKNGWGQRWGIFVISGAGLERVIAHLRKFTMVEDDQGRRVFFRFYDPRTLRQYLPVFTPDQSAVFFREITACLCEDTREPGTVIEFRPGPHGQLVWKRHTLEDERKEAGQAGGPGAPWLQSPDGAPLPGHAALEGPDQRHPVPSGAQHRATDTEPGSRQAPSGSRHRTIDTASDARQAPSGSRHRAIDNEPGTRQAPSGSPHRATDTGPDARLPTSAAPPLPDSTDARPVPFGARPC